MSVVPYRPSAASTAVEPRRDWVELMTPAVELARNVAETEFVPKGLRGNPAAITAAILFGDEVGLGPMQSLAKIAVVDGKPTLAAEAQRALVLAAGHELWVEEASATRVTVVGRRRDSEISTRVTWTIDDAKRAGLAGKPNWRSYPRQMLLARASAELSRAVFADAIGGLFATEELVDDLGDVADLPVGEVTAPKTSRRSRKRAVAAAPEPPASDVAKPEVPGLPGEDVERDEGDEPPEGAVVTAPDGPKTPPPASTAEEPPDDPSPEPQASTDVNEPLANEAQRRKLFASYRDAGLTGRDERLAHAERVLGHPLTTSKALTSSEASRLIDDLDRLDGLVAESEHARAEEEVATSPRETGSNAAGAAHNPAPALPDREQAVVDEVYEVFGPDVHEVPLPGEQS